MIDISNAVKNSLAIVKKRINFDNIEDNDPEMLQLFNELLTANSSIIIRNQLDKRMRCFSQQKDKELVNAIWNA